MIWNDVTREQLRCSTQDLVYLPQMCSMKTDAMNSRDITKTGTGPLKQTIHYQQYDIKLMFISTKLTVCTCDTYTLMPGESSVQNLHMPPLLVPVLRFLAAVVVVVFTLCLTVPPLADLGATAFDGDLLADPTDVALGAAG